MRIVRFSPGGADPSLGLGSDPLFGLINEDNVIAVLVGDPLYAGITPNGKSVPLQQVRLLAPVLPVRSPVLFSANDFCFPGLKFHPSVCSSSIA